MKTPRKRCFEIPPEELDVSVERIESGRMFETVDTAVWKEREVRTENKIGVMNLQEVRRGRWLENSGRAATRRKN